MKRHTIHTSKFSSILKCYDYLERIANENSSSQQSKLIKKAKTCAINAISEIVLNCLKGNIPLKNCDFNNLSKYKSLLRKLAKKSSVKLKKKYIIQSGKGFNIIQTLILIGLKFIDSIISKNEFQKNETCER